MSFYVYYLRIRTVEKKTLEGEFIPTQRDASFHRFVFVPLSLSQLSGSSLKAGAPSFFSMSLAPGT